MSRRFILSKFADSILRIFIPYIFSRSYNLLLNFDLLYKTDKFAFIPKKNPIEYIFWIEHWKKSKYIDTNVKKKLSKAPSFFYEKIVHVLE